MCRSMLRCCINIMPAGGQSHVWEHVKVLYKHHACWRTESCVGACKDVVSTPCLLEVRVMRGSMLRCCINTMPAGGQSHV